MTKRYNNFDLFRCISLLGVFCLHMQRESLLHVYLARLGTMSVSCFFMMSGAFILSNDKIVSVKDWMKKTWYKLIIPWFLAVILYLTEGLAFQFLHTGKIDFMIEIESLMKYGYPIRGWHLWYMYAIVEIYLLIPILKWLRKKNKIIYFACGVTIFVVSIILRKLQIYLPWFLHFFDYIYLYILGDFIFCYCSRLERKSKRVLYGIAILMLCLLFYDSYLDFFFDKNLSILNNDFSTLILIALWMLVFTNMKIEISTYPLTKFFLPIYILHIFVGDFWSGISRIIHFDMCNAWWTIIVDCAVVFIGCYLLCVFFEYFKRKILNDKKTE